MPPIRRALAVPILLLAAACGGAEDKSTTVDVWVSWSGEAVDDLERIIDRYEAEHPNVTVKVTPGVDDPAKILAAITAGNPPDLVTAFKVEDLGRYCGTGAWTDLTPRIKAAELDMEGLFSPVALESTQFEGKTCGIPYIADAFGLFYNIDKLEAAGLSEPPRTLSELSAMARKLTEFNPDGSIKVAGYVPLINWYQSYSLRFPPLFDGDYFDADGKASLSSDKDWTDFLLWQRELIDFYGYKALKTFSAKAGNEWTAEHAFQSGKVAMLLDGEWRTGAIGEQAPNLRYGTAPMPVADKHADLYGGGHVTVGFGLIPKGASDADAAWELLRYLATDTDAVVDWSNRLQNIPTTTDALNSNVLELDAHIDPFLDIYSSEHAGIAPILQEGGIYFAPIDEFLERWQNGSIPTRDLQTELEKLDARIDTVMAGAS